jgi:hypothetical protein
LNKIVESNSTNDSPSVIPTLADTTVAQYLSELLSKLNFLNLQDFDLSSVLQHIPLPVTALQHFTIAIILFNVIIFNSLMSLIVNHYIKLYGDKFISKVPKWSLSIVKYYIKARQFSNYYLIVIIMVCLVFPTTLCLFIYISEHIKI